MSEENVGLLVEFKAKYDTVTAGFNQLSQGNQHLQNDVKKTEDSFTRMSNSVTSSLSSIKHGLEALIVGVVFDKLLGGFDKIAAGILNVQNTAAGLGIPVNDFQKLAFAANLSDVNIDSLSTTLKRFSGNIGKAIEGDQNVIDSLKSIGVSVDDLKGKGVADQFLIAAQAAGRLKDANIAAASGIALFGRDYTQALRLGREGIADNIKEFDKLGVTLTNTQRTSVDEFNKSKKTLDTLWDGFLQKIVGDVSPELTKLTNEIINFIQESGGIDGLANNVAGKIVTIVDYASSAFETFIPVVQTLFHQLGILIEDSKVLFNHAQQFAQEISDRASGNKTDSTVSHIVDFLTDTTNAQQDTYDPNTPYSHVPSLLGIQNKGNSSNPYDTLTQSIIPKFTKMATIVDKTKDSIQDLGDAVTKSADKITEGFKSIDGKALTDELNKIFNIISPAPVDKQAQFDDWATQQRAQLVANKQDTTSFDNQLAANKGLNTPYDTSDFDKLAAGLIKGLKAGDVSSAGFNLGLRNLALQQQVDIKSGLNTDTESKVVEEIKKFADSLGVKTQQQVNVDISVVPTKDFFIHWTTSQDFKDATQRQQAAALQLASKSMGTK